MIEFQVEVSRTYSASTVIPVQALNKLEAEFKALNQIGDIDLSGKLQYVDDEVLGITHEPLIKCLLCRQWAPGKTAHLHGDQWIGDECCWEERLRISA